MLCSVRNEHSRNSVIAADCPVTSSSSRVIRCITRVCTLSTNASSICFWLRSDSALSFGSTSAMREPTFSSSHPCNSPRSRTPISLKASICRSSLTEQGSDRCHLGSLLFEPHAGIGKPAGLQIPQPAFQRPEPSRKLASEFLLP